MSDKEKLLVCRRMVGGGEPAVESVQDVCDMCAAPIWRAASSPKDATPICMDCFLKLNPQEMNFAGPTKEQAEEIRAYYEAHPEEHSSKDQLTTVIERLCDSLRDLRRNHPESFFGQPVETLYSRLEAALGSFYRSKVESTSPEAKTDLEPPW